MERSNPNSQHGDSTPEELRRRLEGATTLLHILSEKFTFSPKSPRKPESKREWELLSALSAIANLCVRTQEVVAVVVKDTAARELLVARGAKAPGLGKWESQYRSFNHPTVHIVENPGQSSTRSECFPIEFVKPTILASEMVGKTALQLYCQNKDTAFENHVTIVGFIINEILAGTPESSEKLIAYAILPSTGKLRKRLHGVFYAAFTSPLELEHDARLPKRPIEVSAEEHAAWRTLMKLMGCTAESLTAQLKSRYVTGEAAMEAYSVLVGTIMRIDKVHRTLEKLLKRKQASEEAVYDALEDITILLVNLDVVVHGELVKYLISFQTLILETKLNDERSRRAAELEVKNRGQEVGAVKEGAAGKTEGRGEGEEYKDAGKRKEEGSGGEDAEQEEDAEDAEDTEDDEDDEDDENEDDKNEDDDHGIDVESLRPIDPSVPKPLASQFLTWLRLVCTTVHSSMSIRSDQDAKPAERNLSFEILVCAQPSITVDWERTVRDLVPAARSKGLIWDLRKEFAGILAQPNIKFQGRPHCEATLGAVWSAATVRHKDVSAQQQGLLARVSKPLNVFGVSKLCCPVCWLILGHLDDKTPIITAGHHSKFFPCTFPPNLPVVVMEGVVVAVEEQLTSALARYKPNQRKAASSQQSKELPSESGTISNLLKLSEKIEKRIGARANR